VPEKKVAAGVFDVADDARGRVDAAIVAHEVDDSRFVHGDFPRMGETGLQAGFHFRSWPGIFGIPALLCLLENPMSSTENLKPGLKGTAKLVVGEEHTAPRVGSGRVHVLATPVMINVIEAAALAAIEHLLPEGHQSLGTRLDIRHFAATPVGMRVHAEVEVVKVEGRTVTFRVSVADEKEPIGDGTHERMVVNVARFDVRVQDKVAMVRGRTL
jgi:fluoroacetyl-CoA thioesterase